MVSEDVNPQPVHFIAWPHWPLVDPPDNLAVLRDSQEPRVTHFPSSYIGIFALENEQDAHGWLAKIDCQGRCAKRLALC